MHLATPNDLPTISQRRLCDPIQAGIGRLRTLVVIILNFLYHLDADDQRYCLVNGGRCHSLPFRIG